MTKAQNKKAIRQAITENFSPGRRFKANELKPYTAIPTHIVGHYLAQLDNIRVVDTEKVGHGQRIRIYEVIN